MDSNLTFIFYHYGPIPRYLRHALEHVRIFNPQAEILLVTETGQGETKLSRFGVTTAKISDYPSHELEQFRSDYRHISCFKEKFERFVLERWFVTETIRRRRPDRTYVMLDSDVAVFDDASKLVGSLPDCPICLASMNPHFTFIRGSIADFLGYILDFYRDEERMKQSRIRQQNEKNSAQIFNQGEMQFLFDYLRESENMRFYETDTSFGLVDCNIHLPQGFEHMQLPRRPRKKVFWKREGGKLLPYFRKDGVLQRAFIIHFQGPGKRVFYRFNRMGQTPRSLTAVLANTVFQHSLVARFC
jgi:hypothetical protein